MDRNEALKRLGDCGVVPVVVLDDVRDAVPAARAMFAGGIDVMEITLRTAAGLDSIREVAEHCPEVLVGAGTVTSLEQCRQCVDAGAAFIVSPGFDRVLVKWCVENGVAVTPGCVTPTEITEAAAFGLDVLKFFPANVYGGLAAMRALSAPFGNIRFIPTGGVNGKNIGEYAGAPFVYAIGGSWICAREDIKEGNFEKITELCREAVRNMLGFEFAHLGINVPGDEESRNVVRQFRDAFGFEEKYGASSNFAGAGFEVMKSMYLGANGHIAIRTNNIRRAAAHLEKKGFAVDPDTEKYAGERLIAVYLKDEFGGFAVHLLQKQEEK